MPQLLPFYFVNQLSFALFGLFVVIYVMSRFVLPAFTELFLTRMYITKLLLNSWLFYIFLYIEESIWDFTVFSYFYVSTIFTSRAIRSN